MLTRDSLENNVAVCWTTQKSTYAGPWSLLLIILETFLPILMALFLTQMHFLKLSYESNAYNKLVLMLYTILVPNISCYLKLLVHRPNKNALIYLKISPHTSYIIFIFLKKNLTKFNICFLIETSLL